MKLGVTGGMGCGKSSVTRMLGDAGFACLDADALVRERVLTDPTVIAELRGRYGEAVLTEDGQVDRRRLAERIFTNDEERHWLEALTHPRVYQLTRDALRARPDARWAVEVPLLFEKELANWFDFTVCVACGSEQQLARLEQRGLSRALAGQRISKQLPLARKIELSDFVLWNDGSLRFLQKQVELLLAALPARG